MDVAKIVSMVVAIAMVTTLILPGRQTPAVANSLFKGSSQLLGTAMGTSKPV